MTRYSEETIQKILSATNIVDLVGTYFPLKRAGKDYRANCPFHNEKTPSFYVIPGKQSYHCFGCGAGGTAIRFVMEYENVDFRHALQKLAEWAGIVLAEEDAPDPEAERLRRRRSHLLKVLGEAAKFYHQLLLAAPEAAVARDYLKSRGFHKETAVNWLLGYAPESMKALADWAKSHGFTARDMIDTGLASLRDEENPRAGLYPRFRHRLMFPIHNDYGDVIAFSGRVLDADSKLAKYLNSPETTVFHKGSVLFGMHRAKRPILKAKAALVCEGQMDLIALAEAGLDHAVAPLGTAMTREHARLLKRHTDTVTLCYDGDAAGWKAADRAFAELAPAGLVVNVAELPAGEDPDSLLRKEGADGLRARLEKATSYLDFFFSRRAGQLATGDLTARTAVAREAATVVARFSDTIARENVLRQTAIRLALDTELFRREVRREVLRIEAEGRNVHGGAPGTGEQPAAAPPAAPTILDRTLDTLCHLALISPKARALLAGPEAAGLLEHPAAESLRRLLVANPDTGNPASINTFLASLDATEESRLQAMLSRPAPADPVAATNDCLAKLGELRRRDHHRRVHATRLADHTADITEILRIQAQIQQQVLDRRKPVPQDEGLPSSPEEEPPENPGEDDPF